MPPELPLIQLDRVSKTYTRGGEKIDALEDVTMAIPRGEFAVIIGPSGGGKSTLLHITGGLERPSSGSLVIDNVPLNELSESNLTEFRRDHIGFVFQFYNLIPSLNALDNASLPLIARGMRRREAVRLAGEMLERVGLDRRAKHKPAQLSGGEQQRVAIARAMVGQPDILLADEPTGDLDHAATEEVIRLMRALNCDLSTTVVVTTHNFRFKSEASRLFELDSGALNEIRTG
jgi:ABC-type lipoprotein export system ATPase subunit